MVLNIISVLKSEAWQREMIEAVKGRLKNFEIRDEKTKLDEVFSKISQKSEKNST